MYLRIYYATGDCAGKSYSIQDLVKYSGTFECQDRRLLRSRNIATLPWLCISGVVLFLKRAWVLLKWKSIQLDIFFFW